jgi:hypothetical protein
MTKFLSILFCLFLTISSSGQNNSDTLYIAFWNLQNLFDTIDDPFKNDEEFLPNGALEWTEERLDKKMYNLARVIRSMNNEQGPDLLGVCEVENQSVLDSMLIRYLPDINFKIAYVESPDNRGIDNGLIYRADKFRLLNIQSDTVHLSDGWPTRLILGVNLLTKNKEKITAFVNHWPSRSGGQMESEPNRIQAAKTLRNAVDRIFDKEPDAKIFIIGDFNDEPADKSIIEYLNAYPIKCDSMAADFEVDPEKELHNLSWELFEIGLGSYKFRDDWNMLDQIIISGSLLVSDNFRYICHTFEIYKPDFLVTHTGNYKGTPFPTYGGRRYLGGYSDHFPVIAKFLIERKSQ